VGKNGFWMIVASILPLLYVDGSIFQRNRRDRAEFFAAELVQVVVTPQIGFLRRKTISMDGRLPLGWMIR
jgi:hypothetical protein